MSKNWKGWDTAALEALQARGITPAIQKRLDHAQECLRPALVPDTKPETNIQQDLVKAFRHRWPEIYASGALFAVPNEGKRSRANASRMKAEGMLSDVADLILLYPSGKFHGACIEMKSVSGRLRPGQSEWLAQREAAGYAVAVCRSVAEGISFFEKYLGK